MLKTLSHLISLWKTLIFDFASTVSGIFSLTLMVLNFTVTWQSVVFLSILLAFSKPFPSVPFLLFLIARNSRSLFLQIFPPSSSPLLYFLLNFFYPLSMFILYFAFLIFFWENFFMCFSKLLAPSLTIFILIFNPSTEFLTVMITCNCLFLTTLCFKWLVFSWKNTFFFFSP